VCQNSRSKRKLLVGVKILTGCNPDSRIKNPDHQEAIRKKQKGLNLRWGIVRSHVEKRAFPAGKNGSSEDGMVIFSKKGGGFINKKNSTRFEKSIHREKKRWWEYQK